MSDYKIPAELRYTKDHEWAKTAGQEVTVGITSFAVEQLGDITLVNIELKPGDKAEAGQRFGTIDSVKTASDLYAPIGGTVVRVNQELENKPELVNEDCYGKAWMVVIQPATPTELDKLMDAKAYAGHLSEAH